MSEEKPTTIVIFGATGDLTKRKLIPALIQLKRKGRLSNPLHVVGFSHTDLSEDEFKQQIRIGTQELGKLTLDDQEWESFSADLHYLRGSFTDAVAFDSLAARLQELENGSADRLYYLSTAPHFYTASVEHLGEKDMVGQEKGWRRVVIEKPFGQDYASAVDLNKQVHSVLSEDQIYRIDHYLGKETVQNIMVFRFANTIFEPLWNRNYIEQVQITVAESVGVGHRGGYYDHAGVIRDMFQNHIMQLLALIASEPPSEFSADPLRDEKVKLLKAVSPIPEDQVAHHFVRGQYAGYRDEPRVDPQSNTATYAAMRLNIDNWRWQGVPFYLRSGKNLAAKSTEVLIQFKSPPIQMFHLPPEYDMASNTIALCIQPDEGIHLDFEAKVPDTAARTRTVDMKFHYADSFGETSIPDAYERLLLDAIQGDPSLFSRSDGIEIAWQLVDPILKAWDSENAPLLETYEPGSWGPAGADNLLAQSKHKWLSGCAH